MEGRKCYGVARDCANCISMMRNEKCDKNSTNSCSCAACRGLELRRCTGCQVVAYCSKLCQTEHWKSNHKAWCQILAWKTRVPAVEHRVGQCRACTPAKSGRFCESLHIRNRAVVSFFNGFGYHMDTECACRVDNREEEQYRSRPENAFPSQFPFQLGENTGVFLGWIDEYLYNLTRLFLKIFTGQHRHLFQPAGNDVTEYMETLRSKYWVYVLIERRPHVSEIHLAQHALSYLPKDCPWSGEAFNKLDLALKGEKYWEQFLASLGEFFKRLRRVKYSSLNLETISEKERAGSLQSLLQLAELQTDRQLDFTLDFSFPLVTRLPADLTCLACQRSLGGETAQHQLQHPNLAWLADTDYHKMDLVNLRLAGRPVIHQKSEAGGEMVVTCGTRACISRGLEEQEENLRKEGRAVLEFLCQAQLCYGCLRHSLRTHRCSQCRAVRYCSNLCLQADWARHQPACRGEVRESLGSRRLEGPEQHNHNLNCDLFLYRCDPLMYLTLGAVDRFKSLRALFSLPDIDERKFLRQTDKPDWWSPALHEAYIRSRKLKKNQTRRK